MQQKKHSAKISLCSKSRARGRIVAFEFERRGPTRINKYRCVIRIALGCEHLPLKAKTRVQQNKTISLCSKYRVRERHFAFKGKGGLSNKKGVQQNSNSNNDDNLAFSQGGLKRGNPATTAKRLRQGVDETHNVNVVGKK